MRKLKRRLRLPSPAMIVAIVAVVTATAGSSYAAFGLGKLSNGAKNKTVGVGKLTYVSTTTAVPAFTVTAVNAQCPGGLRVVGGGIKMTTPTANTTVIIDSNPTTSGWAGHVHSAAANSAVTIAICANSRVVTGAPPA